MAGSSDRETLSRDERRLLAAMQRSTDTLMVIDHLPLPASHKAVKTLTKPQRVIYDTASQAQRQASALLLAELKGEAFEKLEPSIRIAAVVSSILKADPSPHPSGKDIERLYEKLSHEERMGELAHAIITFQVASALIGNPSIPQLDDKTTQALRAAFPYLSDLKITEPAPTTTKPMRPMAVQKGIQKAKEIPKWVAGLACFFKLLVAPFAALIKGILSGINKLVPPRDERITSDRNTGSAPRA